ncbi:MAG: PTS sugar transporter subunit IIA [Mariprofundaceae bacterium]|nr:PTS sugar transporter subunit IIA [Mariprofundaceae bacterium]
MNIDVMIPVEHILLGSTACSKRALISEIAGLLPAMDPNQVLELIMAREHLGSTGIGHGVAIPHSRMSDLPEPVITMVRHPEGIDFDAIDGQPVYIVVMLLVPDDENGQHLELLAKLARLLQKPEFRASIMTASDAQAMSDLFSGVQLP